MTEDSSNGDAPWGCAGTLIFISIIYAIVSAIISWILSWPFLLGHILLGLLSIALLVSIAACLGDALLKWIWPGQILTASDRASQALSGSPVRYEGEILVFLNIKEVDTEERKATANFMELLPGVEGQTREKTIGGIHIQPKTTRISNRLYSLINPAQVYRDSLENAGFQWILQDTPDGKAWCAVMEIVKELERLEETREKAVSFLDDIRKVLAMDPTNELTGGIRKRATAAKPRIESIIEKIDHRGHFLNSSAGKLVELISVPPSIRTLGAGDELEINVVECMGSADDLLEEVRLFEESYSSLLEP